MAVGESLEPVADDPHLQRVPCSLWGLEPAEISKLAVELTDDAFGD